MPEVSVLTAVYADTPDKVAWLHESVGSVLEQDFKDVEIIVVDDCSPLKLGELDARVVRTTRQQGPAAARNTAVALAQSDALLALDSDDLLSDPGALSAMFEVWAANPDRVVYGDLQQYNLVDGAFQRQKVVKFPHYTFRQSLNPTGLIPVTALHSRECHVAAGGWKPELEAGLEDVEYWIAAGAAGHCGLKLDRVVLIYRRHGASRTTNMRRQRLEGIARGKIREIHVDLYEGRYPMGCCGESAAVGRSGPIDGQRYVPGPTSLVAFREDEKVWVKYNAKRTGAFGMVGPATRYTYMVEGTGHVFEVHVNDVQLFRRSGRGQDFSVGVAPPEPEPESVVKEVREFQAAPPVMAEIEQLDEISAAEHGVELPEKPEEIKLPEETPEEIEEIRLPEAQPKREIDLASLGLTDAVHRALHGWTVERLAGATVSDLTPIRGIGIVTAARVIDGAKNALA